MSRIAGIVGKRNQPPADVARAILEGLRSNPNWKQVVNGESHASLMWVGWRTPVVAQRHRAIAVVDGLFYNRAEIDSLIPDDICRNDSERLIACFRKYGLPQALGMINGDFSIALWDLDTSEMWIARDRFGVKPLYYAETPDFFAFASKTRALLRLPGLSGEINRRFTAIFAGGHYRYIDNYPEESPYKNINQLPAGHWLRLANNRITTGRYWDLKEEPDWYCSEQDLADQYRTLLFDAVKLRVESVGSDAAFTLSGGLDSSSVLSCAVEVTGRRQDAFSTVYADSTYDESNEIRSMLTTKVKQWCPVEIGMPDVMNLIDQMVRIHDEPVATATWLSHYLLCDEVARQGFGTLFGGLGGDELNAGEYEYFIFHFADLRGDVNTRLLSHEVNCWQKHHDHPIYRKNMLVVNDAFERMVDLGEPGRCLPDTSRMRKYYAAIDPSYFDLEDFTPRLEHRFANYLKNRTYQDLFQETAPCCLRAEDRQTTAFELDHVDPFFDHRLAEFMFRVPGKMKIRDGITKRLLREAMRGVLPEETRTRIKKTGWNAPAHAWFSDGKSAQALGDLINSRSFRERGLYRVDVVKKLFEDHTRIVKTEVPTENHMMFFWQLINVEVWLSNAEVNDAI